MASLKKALFPKEIIASIIIGLFLLFAAISAAASIKYLICTIEGHDMAPPASCDPPPLFHAPANE